MIKTCWNQNKYFAVFCLECVLIAVTKPHICDYKIRPLICVHNFPYLLILFVILNTFSLMLAQWAFAFLPWRTSEYGHKIRLFSFIKPRSRFFYVHQYQKLIILWYNLSSCAYNAVDNSIERRMFVEPIGTRTIYMRAPHATVMFFVLAPSYSN